ncbi:MAG: hypothetical protein SH850_23275 [Planctomycetaceae bacterium]|nr:hypothetical protein [Planctomycetaceae bacterium]
MFDIIKQKKPRDCNPWASVCDSHLQEESGRKEKTAKPQAWVRSHACGFEGLLFLPR